MSAGLLRVATLAAAVLLVLAPSAPAKAPPGPAAVVRAWTAALNRSDNEAAANLFAKNAVVIQNGLKLVFFTHHLAVLWMEGVPCSGRLIRVRVTQNIADAIFVLGSRKGIKVRRPGHQGTSCLRRPERKDRSLGAAPGAEVGKRTCFGGAELRESGPDTLGRSSAEGGDVEPSVSQLPVRHIQLDYDNISRSAGPAECLIGGGDGAHSECGCDGDCA